MQKVKVYHFLLILLLIFVIVSSSDSFGCDDSKIRSCFPKGCVNSTCQKCTADWMCLESKGHLCNKNSGKCGLGYLSTFRLNVEWYEILGFVVCFVIVIVAVIGGIGGGIMLVSAMIVVGQFHVSTTSPYSSTIVLGASIAAFVMQVMKKHPHKNCNRPLIDYDLVATVQPIIISGTLFGVLLNAIFPSWAHLLVIMGIYCFSFFNVTRKIWKMRKKENKMRERKKKLRKRVEDGVEIVEVNSKDVKVEAKKVMIAFEEFELKDVTVCKERAEKLVVELGKKKQVVVAGEEEARGKVKGELMGALEELGEKEEEKEAETVDPKLTKWKKIVEWYDTVQLPIWKWAWILFAWVVILLASLFKGSKKVKSVVGVEQCSGWYWGIIVITFFVLLFQGYFHSFLMYAKFRIQEKTNYVYYEGDMKWNHWRAIFLPVIFVSSGVVASLVGTGGGLINGPLMMLFGMNAQVTIATNLFMIMITSSSSVIQFLVGKKIYWDYAIALMALGFIASLLGRLSSSYIIKKTGRRSSIVVVLDVLIVVSAIASLGVGIFKIVLSVKNGENQGFDGSALGC